MRMRHLLRRASNSRRFWRRMHSGACGRPPRAESTGKGWGHTEWSEGDGRGGYRGGLSLQGSFGVL